MEQPNKAERANYMADVLDIPSFVAIPNTKKKVKIRGIKPYTIERLTRLWTERETTVPTDSASTLKSVAAEPYFSVKQAVLIVLNDYWKIRLFYPFMWRLWGKLRGYTEDQMSPIIIEGKKKLPLTAHWRNMAFSVDMRADWMKLTKEEAEQYRAEQISAVNALLSKTTLNTGKQDDSSSA